MSRGTYLVRYIIVYSDGQRTTTEQSLNLEGASESLAIDTLRRQGSAPKDANYIIINMQKIS
jgi:hypothetical protein